ncbi:hypothetical protein L486_08286 [Kwoniella mangroviensis CBS 10435]|uniref:CN hydrolase domain-containing protein n=1 Tax=Kwoniella mangroviensis CBS 10435 TaxID=1331196 RepID=A0A1B9IFU0_9TREE|nr:uncharacterized protein I203_08303 [Kwoniella mangroviensis CBS 8507]OCF54372.1 hypothetical protein L486_08286 [Kwoniella mangroviensis CBS 10435]OCF62620.1 hypothetical protein I203_08303 [Kwoniella mangroviensis CBS 8507]OCF70831.1 hypothetical protein I204_08521 [Kwoniella mangroviensis CBS 8886]
MVAKEKVRVAVPQIEPSWLDKDSGLQRILEVIKEASEEDAKLIAFGELFLPGYPSFLYGGRMNDVYKHGIQYANNAVEVDGPEIAAIRYAARDNKIIVHVGFTERDGKSLYMSNVIIDEHGEVLLHRRKIKPSHYERVLHGEGGPESAINCVETSIGRISVLNCWEHFQPLLKFHTYHQRPLIHIAAWPMLHPYGGEEQWAHCVDSGVGVTRTVACESGAFVLCATNILTEKGMKINHVPGISVNTGDAAGHIQPGGGFSAVYAPDGSKLSKDISDLEETVLYVDLDLDMVPFAALVQDTVGHYSRPDMFHLVVKSQPAPLVVYQTEDGKQISAPSRVKPFKALPPLEGHL